MGERNPKEISRLEFSAFGSMITFLLTYPIKLKVAEVIAVELVKENFPKELEVVPRVEGALIKIVTNPND